jgi:hypothetical protein
MSEPNAAVLDEVLAPAEEKHPVSKYDSSEWASYDSIDLTSDAFDVIVASSETDARRAENSYRCLCLLSTGWIKRSSISTEGRARLLRICQAREASIIRGGVSPNHGHSARRALKVGYQPGYSSDGFSRTPIHTSLYG